MEEQKKKEAINLGLLWKKTWSRKALFIKVWIITFILSCVWILPQPRYYTVEVSIAPESSDTKEMGNLASIASNFGLNIGGGSTDAIYPQLYPDLFKSTQFLVGLLDVQVKTKDGSVNTDYYTYLKQHQKTNTLLYPLHVVKKWLKSLFENEETESQEEAEGRFDPFQLSKKTTDIVDVVQGNIQCTYSRTTDVVTIKVTDQDPLVCALLADSIKEHLQTFITDYRTKKARIDYEHYKKLTDEARLSYDHSREVYASFADANTNVALKSYELKMESLENDMQTKYNIYTAMSTRLEAAMAKVQEATPVFTDLKNATVPVKPAGPKRMIFVASMLFLATLGTMAYLFKTELREWF